MEVNTNEIFRDVHISGECALVLAQKRYELWRRATDSDDNDLATGELRGFNLALTMLGLIPAANEASKVEG